MIVCVRAEHGGAGAGDVARAGVRAVGGPDQLIGAREAHVRLEVDQRPFRDDGAVRRLGDLDADRLERPDAHVEGLDRARDVAVGEQRVHGAALAGVEGELELVIGRPGSRDVDAVGRRAAHVPVELHPGVQRAAGLDAGEPRVARAVLQLDLHHGGAQVSDGPDRAGQLVAAGPHVVDDLLRRSFERGRVENATSVKRAVALRHRGLERLVAYPAPMGVLEIVPGGERPVGPQHVVDVLGRGAALEQRVQGRPGRRPVRTDEVDPEVLDFVGRIVVVPGLLHRDVHLAKRALLSVSDGGGGVRGRVLDEARCALEDPVLPRLGELVPTDRRVVELDRVEELHAGGVLRRGAGALVAGDAEVRRRDVHATDTVTDPGPVLADLVEVVRALLAAHLTGDAGQVRPAKVGNEVVVDVAKERAHGTLLARAAHRRVGGRAETDALDHEVLALLAEVEAQEPLRLQRRGPLRFGPARRLGGPRRRRLVDFEDVERRRRVPVAFDQDHLVPFLGQGAQAHDEHLVVRVDHAGQDAPEMVVGGAEPVGGRVLCGEPDRERKAGRLGVIRDGKRQPERRVASQVAILVARQANDVAHGARLGRQGRPGQHRGSLDRDLHRR
ncbi:MAG: hypothetical protein U5J97_10535 [Trueperaceae bacterium]|nr:hypothetical protein [Trueperaceae bacterium]